MGVGEIPREHAPQMAFAEHDDVVQTVATYRFDQSFHVRVLPRTRRTGDDLGDAHAGDTTLADAAIDRIAISQSHFGAVSFGNAATICCAVHSAVGCSVTVIWMTRRRSRARRTSTKQHAAGHRRHREEVHRDQRGEVIREEGSPRL
jgi:uncharacterized iron-regulated membrane protein